jgi:hypothetical protein
MGDRAAGQAMAGRVDASHFRGGRLRCFLPAGLGLDVAQGWESGGRVGGRPETRLGCSPRASARGSPLGGRRGAPFGCSPRAGARGSPMGGAGDHRSDAALARARGEARWGALGHGWDAALAQARGEARLERGKHGWDAALGQGRGEIRLGRARGSPGRAPGERRPRAEAAVKRCCGRAGGCLDLSASFSGGGASAGRAHRWRR